MSDMPEKIYAYPYAVATGGYWSDSDHHNAHIASVQYVRADLVPAPVDDKAVSAGDFATLAARYEEYRAKYVGGTIYHANNAEAQTEAMRYALAALTNTPASNGVDAACPECRGDGYVIGTDTDCCGDFQENGECKGYCCVPVQVQEPCQVCGGHGSVKADADNKAALDALIELVDIADDAYYQNGEQHEYAETIRAALQGAAMSQKVDVEKVRKLATKIYDLIDVEDANDPLDDAIRWGKEILDALPPQPKGGE